MEDDKNILEIRRSASGVIWHLSMELKNISENNNHLINDVEIIRDISRLIEWLSAIVCDDWPMVQTVDDLYKEILLMSIPEYLINKTLWDRFCELIAEQTKQSLIYGSDKKDSVESNRFNINEFVMLGYEYGFLKPQKKLFRKALVVVNQ